MTAVEAMRRGLARALARADAAMNRLYGWRGNPLYQTGTLAVLAFVVMFATGVYLLFFYRVSDPYASMQAIEAQAWGGQWIRALHRYASDLTLAAAAVHAAGSDWDRASTCYRLALSVVARVDADRRGEIQGALNALRDRQKLEAKVEQLKKKLAAAQSTNPAVAATTADELVRLLVLEMDRPQEARKYTFLSQDDELKTQVQLATRPLDALDTEVRRGKRAAPPRETREKGARSA